MTFIEDNVEKKRGSVRVSVGVRIAALVLVLVLIILIVVLKPFQKETQQLEDLRTITQTEKDAQSISSKVENYLQREQGIKKIASLTPSPIEKKPDVGYNAFASEEITKEAEKTALYDLQLPLDRELKLYELQADITTIISKL